jgi:hypothetical protein
VGGGAGEGLRVGEVFCTGGGVLLGGSLGESLEEEEEEAAAAVLGGSGARGACFALGLEGVPTLREFEENDLSIRELFEEVRATEGGGGVLKLRSSSLLFVLLLEGVEGEDVVAPESSWRVDSIWDKLNSVRF